MRIRFRNAHAGAVPLLIARQSTVPPVGTVLWYHGFGVDKETHRKELTRFAAEGFIAVGIDVVGHGERRAHDLDVRMDASQEEARDSVIEFAGATARELPQLIDYLVQHKLAVHDRVALAGISMGAFVVYRALTEDNRIASAVAILGSPAWPTHDSPHTRVAELCRIPLLSITAECDVNVPPAPARALHERLAAQCKTGNHRYIELPDAEHLMNPDDWETTMTHTISWLQTNF